MSLHATRRLAAALCAGCAIAACSRDSDRAARGDESPLVGLTLELTIGEDPAAGPEYQFGDIATVYVARDAHTWVVDGAPGFVRTDPEVRVFDAAGRFVRHVGAEGDGPGEYRRPYGIAELGDGRMAVRDIGGSGRILIYTRAGEPLETWTPGTLGTGRLTGPVGPIVVDTSGVIWLMVWPRPTSPSEQAEPVYVRVLPIGTALDTVRPPDVPRVDGDAIRRWQVRNGLYSFRIPFAPLGINALHPSGGFALAAQNEYRVWLVPSPGNPQAPRSLLAERAVPPVPISDRERAGALERLRGGFAGVEGFPEPSLEEVPTVKPLLTFLRFAADGRLLVGVSMPGELRDGEWTEPWAYDVFDVDGTYQARIVLPEGFYLHDLSGDRLWGVARDDLGVESVRFYRITWP